MSNLSKVDLQNLRHLIGGFDTSHSKMQEYASQVEDAKLKSFFQSGAKFAMENKQKLMGFLQ